MPFCISRILAIALGLLVLSLPALAWAESGSASPGGSSGQSAAKQTSALQLEETVVTATGHASQAFDTSMPMNVITAEDLERRGAVSMEDVFRGEAGLNVSATGPNSVRPMIRGLYDERVLILVNGVRLSEQRPGGNHILSLDPAQIERIEVVRGPSSVLYGSDAIGGVINVITKQPRQEKGPQARTGVEASGAGFSNPEGWRAGANLYFGQGEFNGLAGGFFRNTDDVETPQGKLNNSSYRGGMSWAAGNYLGDVWRWDLNYYYMNADMGIPADSSFISDKFAGERQHLFSGKLSREGLGAVADRLELIMGAQRHERHRERISYSPNPSVVKGNLKVDILLDIDTYSLKPMFFKKLGDRHQLTYGLDAFYENADSDRFIKDTASSWVNPAFNGVPVIPDSQRTGLGIFVQDEISLGPRWQLTAGLRHDWIESETDGHPRHEISSSQSQEDSAFSGNLGILFRASEIINLYANAGRAFRAPTLLERYFFGPHDSAKNDVGDPNLEPETSWNFDLGVKFRSGRLSGSTGVFYNIIQDYIAKVDTGQALSWTNFDEVRLYGGELNLEADIWRDLAAYAAVSYVIGQDEDRNQDLPAIPPLNGRLGLRQEWVLGQGNRLWADLGMLWAARQDRVGANEKETSGWTRFDFRAGYGFSPNAKLTFAVENIGDRLYHDHLSRVWQDLDLADQPGRAFKLMLEMGF